MQRPRTRVQCIVFSNSMPPLHSGATVQLPEDAQVGLGRPLGQGRPTAGAPPGAGSWIAIRIRRAVAALQVDLVRQVALWPVDEEFRVERNAAARLGVELHHPAVEAAFIKLSV